MNPRLICHAVWRLIPNRFPRDVVVSVERRISRTVSASTFLQARPRICLSFMLSASVPRDRWAGLQQQGLSHE